MDSEIQENCWNCGRLLLPGHRVCQCGADTGSSSRGSRETSLLLILLALVGAFAATAVLARFYHNRLRDLAESWFAQGTSDLHAGNASAALSDFRTALIYARQDLPDAQRQALSLNLAQSLVANHRLDEAHAYLLDLWQSTPDSARVNLELAHLSVAMGEDTDAKRYYANAIYGIWQGSPEQVRQYQRDTQLEFCRYLLDRKEATAAQSVLLSVAASLPRDAALHIKVGEMMLEAGAAAQALEQYQQALEIDRRNRDALIGAGLSSFDMSNDGGAVRYLGQASAQRAQSEQSVALPPGAERDLAVANADLALDFLELGLDPKERAHRAVHAYDVAKTRLEDCAKSLGVSLPVPTARIPSRVNAPGPSTDPSSTVGASNGSPTPDDLSTAYEQGLKMQSSWREAALERSPQLIDALGKFVFEVESAAGSRCGSPADVEDMALARLGRRYAGQNP